MNGKDSKVRIKVGLEIHQQLATKSKLFCSCKPVEVKEHEYQFFRRLRPTQSELGEYDQAALFEFKKGKVIRYLASSTNVCLVEMDEEPPHEINREALEIAFTIALALNAKIVDEVHVMRKIVIDGSNTTGFQRTMLIALGGYIDDVKIQTISLEEDAARIVEESNEMKSYALDRLGVPLIEISLEPVTKSPEEIAELALKIGRLMRASKRVARGLGTIRQDVNISIDDGNVVEIKGVQKLDQLINVIKYETKRQQGLMIIAEMLRKRVNSINTLVRDVSHIFKDSNSKVISNALHSKGCVKAIKVEKFAGMLGFEPYEGIRLGKELGEMVRFYGLGGIFHSDELPAYGIRKEELDGIKSILNASDEDAIIILAGREEDIDHAISAIVKRLEDALNGVPAETRAATADGRTVYSRPRPGAARMYPETDIEPVVITKDMLESLKIPKGWDEYVNELSVRYNINKVLAEKIFDSDYLNIFESIVESCKNVQPSFIASTLAEGITSLEREGYDTSLLSDAILIDLFKRLDEQVIAKESLLDILKVIISKRCDLNTAIKVLALESISDEEVEKIIDKIFDENSLLIKERGEKAFSILMGKAMGELRGKVDGKKVSMLIKNKIANYK